MAVENRNGAVPSPTSRLARQAQYGMPRAEPELDGIPYPLAKPAANRGLLVI
jgi:hypothetical protein